LTTTSRLGRIITIYKAMHSYNIDLDYSLIFRKMRGSKSQRGLLILLTLVVLSKLYMHMLINWMKKSCSKQFLLFWIML